MEFKQELLKVLELTTIAEQMDFDQTRLIKAENIILDERVRMQCQVNLCGNYQNNLMCPPFLPPISEIKLMLSKYNYALLTTRRRKINLEDNDSPHEFFISQALLLNKMMIQLEKQAFCLGFPLALAMGAGECKLCNTCVIKDGSTRCCQPGDSRPSMEGMGINVLQTFNSAGISMEFKTGEITIAGLLLIN